jgi:hypothetical protein
MGKKKLQIKVSGAQARAAKDQKSQSDTRVKPVAPKTLAEELARHHLRIAEVSADGNCFFRAVADQLEVRTFCHSLISTVLKSYKIHSDAQIDL